MNINSKLSSRLKVGLLGATGMVGRRLAQLLVDHPWFEPVIFVGSETSIGTSYRLLWERKEKLLQGHYGMQLWNVQHFPKALDGTTISGFPDLLNSDIEIVFSSLPERAGAFEATLLDSGRIVFSNSPYRRFDVSAALVVAEVNGNEMRECRLIKNPNCVTSGLALVLAPIASRYGLDAVVVTTYQSISGRGDARYAADLVIGNVYPLFGSEEQTEGNIRRELDRVFRSSFVASITCNRVCVQEGHFVEVRIKTKNPIESAEEVLHTLSLFNPLKSLGLPLSPAQPLVVVHEAGRPRPLQDSDHSRGMAVAVGNISIDDDVFDLRLTYVVNNLVRGAAGGAVLNSELWFHQKMRARSDSAETLRTRTALHSSS